MRLSPDQRALWASPEVQELFARLLASSEREREEVLKQCDPSVASLLMERFEASLAQALGTGAQAYAW